MDNNNWIIITSNDSLTYVIEALWSISGTQMLVYFRLLLDVIVIHFAIRYTDTGFILAMLLSGLAIV